MHCISVRFYEMDHPSFYLRIRWNWWWARIHLGIGGILVYLIQSIHNPFRNYFPYIINKMKIYNIHFFNKLYLRMLVSYIKEKYINFPIRTSMSVCRSEFYELGKSPFRKKGKCCLWFLWRRHLRVGIISIIW